MPPLESLIITGAALAAAAAIVVFVAVAFINYLRS